jgi:hypothetical protein
MRPSIPFVQGGPRVVAFWPHLKPERQGVVGNLTAHSPRCREHRHAFRSSTTSAFVVGHTGSDWRRAGLEEVISADWHDFWVPSPFRSDGCSQTSQTAFLGTVTIRKRRLVHLVHEGQVDHVDQLKLPMTRFAKKAPSRPAYRSHSPEPSTESSRDGGEGSAQTDPACTALRVTYEYIFG